MSYTVYFSQSAGTAVRDVEADDAEDAIDKAYDDLPGGLCHQCAARIDLAGDWEPEAVTDNGKTVWERKPTKALLDS